MSTESRGSSSEDLAAHQDACRETLVRLAEFCKLDKLLAEEIDRAKDEWFGSSVPSAGISMQRFLEWFTLERQAEGTGGAPVHAWYRHGFPGLPDGLKPWGRALLESYSDICLLSDSDGGVGTIASSIDGEERALLLPPDDGRLRVGDSLVGRFFQVPGVDAFLASETVEVFRGSAVYHAQSLSETEPGDTALSQLSLERFLEVTRSHAPRSLDSLRSDFEAVLAGTERLPDFDELLHAFSSAVQPGQVMGPFLEQLAFESSVNIEQAQRLCLELWNHLHETSDNGEETHAAEGEDSRRRRPMPDSVLSKDPTAHEAPKPKPYRSGKELLAEIEAAEARGERLADVLDRISSELGNDPEDAAGLGVPASVNWETEDDGKLEILGTEFLWERRQVGKEDGRVGEGLKSVLKSFAAAKLDEPERIERAFLARALCPLWLEDNSHGLEVLRLFVDFSTWLETEQELPLSFPIQGFLAELEVEHERISDSIEILAKHAAEADEPLRPYHVERETEDGWSVRAVAKRSEGRTDAELVEGDLLYGTPSRDGLGFAPGLRILPPLLASSLAQS